MKKCWNFISFVPTTLISFVLLLSGDLFSMNEKYEEPSSDSPSFELDDEELMQDIVAYETALEIADTDISFGEEFANLYEELGRSLKKLDEIKNESCASKINDKKKCTSKKAKNARGSKVGDEILQLFDRDFYPLLKKIALDLDHYENGIVSDEKLSNGKVRKKQSKDFPKACKKKLFPHKLELSIFEEYLVKKYQFMLFQFAVRTKQFTTLLPEIMSSKLRKKDNPIVVMFSKLEYPIAADDIRFLYFKKLYNRHALAKHDQCADIIQLFFQNYKFALRPIGLGMPKSEMAHTCGICLDESKYSLRNKDFCPSTMPCEDSCSMPSITIEEEMPVLSESITLKEEEQHRHDKKCCPSLGSELRSCLPCLGMHVQMELKNRLEPSSRNVFSLALECPGSGCKAKFVSLSSWKFIFSHGLIPKELILKVLQWRIQTLSSGLDEIFLPCTNSECDNFLDLRTTYAKSAISLTCPHCETITCKMCKGKYTGACCDAMELPEGLEIRPCPKCSTYVERDGGCPFVKCPGCNCAFDVTNGELWTKEYAKKKGGSHSSSAMSEETMRKIDHNLKKQNRKNGRKNK